MWKDVKDYEGIYQISSDGRVSRKNRGWALTVEDAESGEEQNKHGIYLPNSPHPAHIDQIADAMRKLDENK